jgi:hypothetical protein
VTKATWESDGTVRAGVEALAAETGAATAASPNARNIAAEDAMERSRLRCIDCYVRRHRRDFLYANRVPDVDNLVGSTLTSHVTELAMKHAS